MIQFNLLPDVKIYYLRANRQKHIVMLISIITIVASVIALVVLLTIIYGLQRKNVSDLNRDIKSASSQLQSTENLTKILTVQNQLDVLPSLHESKPVATRWFSYIAQATPPNVTNSRSILDFGQNEINLSGTANSLNAVNVFIDNLKATKYSTDSSPSTKKAAFSDVTLSAFGRDNQNATYTITFNFDPVIFSENDNVTFSITSSTGTGQ